MITTRLLLFVVFAAGYDLRAQEKATVMTALRELQPGRPLDAQLDALRRIATSLDPRIPAACLPLLDSGGESIKRNAARAVGSRWHQIPGEQIAPYHAALKANLKSADPAIVNMARRAIGLLDRSYAGDMFGRSRNKRWVIYERRGKPCLIDTQDGTEELLGHDAEIFFLPALGNKPVKGSCLWHPKQDMVALQMVVFRRPRIVWVWRHSRGLRPILPKELLEVLKPAQGDAQQSTFFSADIKSWEGAALDIAVEYTLRRGESVTDHAAVVRWDSATNKLSVVSRQLAR